MCVLSIPSLWLSLSVICSQHRPHGHPFPPPSGNLEDRPTDHLRRSSAMWGKAQLEREGERDEEERPGSRDGRCARKWRLADKGSTDRFLTFARFDRIWTHGSLVCGALRSKAGAARSSGTNVQSLRFKMRCSKPRNRRIQNTRGPSREVMTTLSASGCGSLRHL